MGFMDDVMANYKDAPKVGEKVKGKVVSIENQKTIKLDIGCFTEGTMHLEYFTKDPNVESFEGLVNVGDEIECEVARVDEQH